MGDFFTPVDVCEEALFGEAENIADVSGLQGEKFKIGMRIPPDLYIFTECLRPLSRKEKKKDINKACIDLYKSCITPAAGL